MNSLSETSLSLLVSTRAATVTQSGELPWQTGANAGRSHLGHDVVSHPRPFLLHLDAAVLAGVCVDLLQLGHKREA